MRFIQVLIITVILLGILLAIVFSQEKNRPKNTSESRQDKQQTDTSINRSAKIFVGVIGISVIALCVTVVVFHMVG